MRELFDPVVNGLAGVLIDLGLDAVEPKSIVGGATDRSHGDIAIPFHTVSYTHLTLPTTSMV